MNKDASTQLYELAGVGKEYTGPGENVVIINEADFSISMGETLAILGFSGSGKSTLLHILGLLDSPTRGTVCFEGQDTSTLNEKQRARIRNHDIGFVFQFHHLLPEFNAMENVAMPLLIRSTRREHAYELAREALEQVGLSHRLEHKVTTLSGGERQRVAIARAIVTRPKVLLADEPTGNLDETTGDRIGSLLAELNKELGMTMVVVTHNPALAAMMHRRMELSRGELYVHSE